MISLTSQKTQSGTIKVDDNELLNNFLYDEDNKSYYSKTTIRRVDIESVNSKSSNIDVNILKKASRNLKVKFLNSWFLYEDFIKYIS